MQPYALTRSSPSACSTACFRRRSSVRSWSWSYVNCSLCLDCEACLPATRGIGPAMKASSNRILRTIKEPCGRGLIGPYISAYVKVHERSKEARHQAELLIQAFDDHLKTAALGQISELADADSPYAPIGCAAQAWSIGELLHAAVEDVYELPLPARTEAAVARV